MQRMVRKQISIEQRQAEQLKRLAKQRGVSEGEIIRQALDRELRAGATSHLPRDRDAWKQALEFMQSRRQLDTSDEEPYHWRREDAYEERLSRFDRKSE